MEELDEFFQYYQDLFFEIPVSGSINSHTYLVEQSQQYIGGSVIDADEIPTKTLIEYLPDIIEGNPTVDVLLVPRINTVEGLTNKHIQQWGWNVNSNGWVNFPDYQWRIWQNKPEIKWKNKVHEVLEGYKIMSTLPSEEEYCLHHPKTIKKQEKQNSYYDTL